MAKEKHKGTAGDGVADRTIARIMGKGDDPLTVKSTRHNEFLGKPTKRDEDHSAILLKSGAQTNFDTARALLHKRIVRMEISRYDVTQYFSDGTALKLSLGGEGIAFTVTTIDKPKPKK